MVRDYAGDGGRGKGRVGEEQQDYHAAERGSGIMDKPKSILLYRFLSPSAALKSIQKRRFKLGRIRDFNDPFEWRMAMEGYRPEGQAAVDAVVEFLIDHVHSRYGMICFSVSAAEPVLWAHYGDNHRGVAFEVDYLNDPEKLLKVEYSDRRPTMDLNQVSTPEGLKEHGWTVLRQLLFRKSPGWAYEQEYRAYEGLDGCDVEDGMYFKRIPDDFLMRVILGFRCELKEDDVRQSLRNVGLTETKVVRAGMDRHTYAITWEKG